MDNFEDFEWLLSLESLKGFKPMDQLTILGNLFDLSLDNKREEGIDHGLKLSEGASVDSFSEHEMIALNYCLANGWTTKRIFKSTTREAAWEFNMLEVSRELFHLRKAIILPGFETIDRERQAQIYTNLGNTLNFLGRFVEGQEYWSKAVTQSPGKSTTLANKGKGLYHYGQYLFDEYHTKLFFLYAYQLVKLALEDQDDNIEGYRTQTVQFCEWLEQQVPEKLRKNLPDLNSYPLGDDLKLKEYRQWCLNLQLYVNPLNDLGNVRIACHDALNLPTMTFASKAPPKYLSLYNQMKQEFGTARFLLYEALTKHDNHYSDADIVIVDTMESALHSFTIEEAKLSFRMAYSLFDKIAFFLNDYLQLNIEATKVNFRTIWYDDYKKKTLKPSFASSMNWAMRGLFWVSKDIFMQLENNDVVIEPEGREIAAIRNHIEHKFFKLVKDKETSRYLYDETGDISYTISQKDFFRKVLKVLKLARASLIYLALAINDEESKKQQSNLPTISVVPTIVPWNEKQGYWEL
jgi:hypothetical protein